MHVHKVSASAHPSPPAAPPRAPHCRQPRPGASQQATGCPAVRGPPPCSATARQQGAPSGMASHSGSELRVLEVDPMLQSHAEHLRYRFQQYQNTRGSIERHAGSLLNFARGAKDYGIHTTDELTVYREWAPAAQAAQLIGDFNGWKPLDMSLGDNGVWFIELPHGPGGAPAIPHGALVKVRLRLPGGEWVDRIPAWIKWAVVPQGEMGAKYVGVHWAPAEAHAWVHPRPPRPATLRIYEAHVGMSSEERAVASYTYFKDSVLPHIHASGYNAIQLMAVQEHAYYGSFGYHVTNPFAASSRSGTPEELKALIDAAHGLGIVVLLDVVHSHISSNCEDGLAGFDFGQGPDENYFLQGDRGYHKEWDSRLFNYAGYEALRYLLSNLHYWIQDMGFDGFRFDGVTSMLYHHHGIGIGFTGNYSEYFSPSTNIDALVYLMLANDMVHELLPSAITIAEDVSGAPTLCRPVGEGGVGFDYRLAMGEPDFWVRTVKQVADEDWSMTGMASALCDRRYSEATVGYVESHDQALVGDQTLAFQLMGTEMYTSMSARQHPLPPRIERGIALHKLIRLITMCLGGESYLNFMGNEFGHPDWIDFPRRVHPYLGVVGTASALPGPAGLGAAAAGTSRDRLDIPYPVDSYYPPSSPAAGRVMAGATSTAAACGACCSPMTCCTPHWGGGMLHAWPWTRREASLPLGTSGSPWQTMHARCWWRRGVPTSLCSTGRPAPATRGWRYQRPAPASTAPCSTPMRGSLGARGGWTAPQSTFLSHGPRKSMAATRH
uniref:Glycosyl hydrolase family 13 catalytic domain-containing protein n=1 Tax=Auxenochlorella protothecoides TaxID=3075 RepID=A0A1D1ZPX8_AUXPR